jgi:tripartite-type tricarboxylate transporter receptor subunit TctC
MANEDCGRTGLFRTCGLFPVLVAVALAPAAIAAQRDTFPSRPVRLIVSNTPGSAPDVVARLLGAKLTESWGQQVVIDNRPGATGLIAAETLAKAAPDGYTLWLNTMTQLISTLQAQRLMLAKDFASVSLVASTPFVIVISASVPPVAETIPGFELLGWYGLQVPLGTPRQLITRINADVVKALKTPELQERLFAVGAEAVGSAPSEFAGFLQKETARWGKVLREGGTIPVNRN